MVVLVFLQMLREVGDAVRKQRDLTSGLPVSPSLTAYSAMIFCLVSASIDIILCGRERGIMPDGRRITGRPTSDRYPPAYG